MYLALRRLVSEPPWQNAIGQVGALLAGVDATSSGSATFVEACLNIRMDRSLAVVHATHDAQQVVRKGVLQEVRDGSGIECTKNILIALIHGEHDDSRRWKLPPNRADGIEAAHLRQLRKRVAAGAYAEDQPSSAEQKTATDGASHPLAE